MQIFIEQMRKLAFIKLVFVGSKGFLGLPIITYEITNAIKLHVPMNTLNVTESSSLNHQRKEPLSFGNCSSTEFILILVCDFSFMVTKYMIDHHRRTLIEWWVLLNVSYIWYWNVYRCKISAKMMLIGITINKIS